MNEKFFDLKKEKQDRIINGCMKVFAFCGYAHASTDEMVREAHISKGLLFHYFGSKSGLYHFLYDYAVRFVTLEITRNTAAVKENFFAAQDALLLAWSDAMRIYPYVQLFLRTAEKERDQAALEEIRERRENFRLLMGDLNDHSTIAENMDPESERKIRRIVQDTLRGIADETDHEQSAWQDRYLREASDTLEIIRKLVFYGN